MKRELGKPRGKMSSYAYFVQTCREEHKKKHPDASVNFSEFSKKCSDRWKVGGIGGIKVVCTSSYMQLSFLIIDGRWYNSSEG